MKTTYSQFAVTRFIELNETLEKLQKYNAPDAVIEAVKKDIEDQASMIMDEDIHKVYMERQEGKK